MYSGSNIGTFPCTILWKNERSFISKKTFIGVKLIIALCKTRALVITIHSLLSVLGDTTIKQLIITSIASFIVFFVIFHHSLIP